MLCPTCQAKERPDDLAAAVADADLLVGHALPSVQVLANRPNIAGHMFRLSNAKMVLHECGDTDRAELVGPWVDRLREAMDVRWRQRDLERLTGTVGPRPAPDADGVASSWRPVDLSVVTGEPEPALILRRTDGVALIYPGRIHSLSGESESLKSWVAMAAGAEVLADGGRFAYIDHEDHAGAFLERMTALGINRDTLNDPDRVRYVRPTEPLSSRDGRATIAAGDFAELAAWRPDLVIVDGVTEGMVSEGLEPLSNADVAEWFRLHLRPLSEAGAAVVQLDHVTKSTETRGRYALGAVAKLNSVDGAAYTVEMLQPLGRARSEPVEGLTRLHIAKDRPGHVRGATTGPIAADIAITAYPDGGVTVTVATSGGIGMDEHRRRILEHLSIYPGSAKTALRSIGNSDAVDRALKSMVADGLVVVEVAGRSHRHHLTDRGQEVAADEGVA